MSEEDVFAFECTRNQDEKSFLEVTANRDSRSHRSNTWFGLEIKKWLLGYLLVICSHLVFAIHHG